MQWQGEYTMVSSRLSSLYDGNLMAMMTDAGRSAMLNPGPHGFSEVLYAVARRSKRGAVVGGGLLGLEAAGALKNLG